MLFRFVRPALFALDPEQAHRLTIAALKCSPVLGPGPPGPLAIKLAGLDKDAEVPDAVLGLGVGFVEVGSITPQPQAGNPRPRLFRLAEDRAVINRMGFNNGGAAAAAERLTARRDRPGIVGVNIGANKVSADRILAYATMARALAPLASHLAVNVAGHNTPRLRDLHHEGAPRELLA